MEISQQSTITGTVTVHFERRNSLRMIGQLSRRCLHLSRASSARILISDPIDPICVSKLTEGGHDVDLKTGLSPKDLISIIGNYEGLVVRSSTTVSADVIQAGEKLKLIGRAGTGYDNIDVKAATKAGVLVMNTPGGNTTSTAELTMSLVVALARKIPAANASMREGKWDRKIIGTELYGKTFGVVGLGKIGLEVSIRAAAFGMKVIAFDPIMSEEIAASHGVKKVNLKTLFEKSDFITLHTPLTKDTKNLISSETLKECKNGVYIINAARGGIVNEKDLLEGLYSGKVAGAALDVLTSEPPTEELKELIAHPNLLCTPHLGASTDEAQIKVAEAIAIQFNDFLKGLETVGIVNAPHFALSFKKFMKPYVALGQALGSLHAQLAPDDLSALNISVKGTDIETTNGQALIASAVLSGLLPRSKANLDSKEEINLINAPYYASEAGLTIETKISESRKNTKLYKNFVSVELKSENNNYTRKILGSVLNGEPIIAQIDSWQDFPSFKPEGNILFFNNIDKPGAINGVLKIMKDNNINVASLGVGRQKTLNSRALAMLAVDSELNEKTINDLDSLGTLQNIKTVSF